MMKAVKLLDSKHLFDDGAVQELVIWEVPKPVLGSRHHYKYRLYYGKEGVRIVGYDNERGKGDHKHLRDTEHPYTFTTIDALVKDFLHDMQEARRT